MKSFVNLSFSLILVVLATYTSLMAQKTVQPDERVNICSDNGDICLNISDIYTAFSDQDGFDISNGSSKTISVKNVVIYNSYHSGALESFESYETKHGDGAAEILQVQDKGSGGVFSDLPKVDGFEAKQVILTNPKFYLVKQYIASKTHLYIITTASRNGESAAIKKFLASVKRNPPGGQTTDTKNMGPLRFSNLKITTVNVTGDKKEQVKSVPSDKPEPDSSAANSLDFVIVSKPKPSYTNTAREIGAKGVIKIKAAFNKNGGIDGLAFQTQLKGGLNRQVIFAILRSKFLPPEKDSVPYDLSRTIEYSFDIY